MTTRAVGICAACGVPALLTVVGKRRVVRCDCDRPLLLPKFFAHALAMGPWMEASKIRDEYAVPRSHEAGIL